MASPARRERRRLQRLETAQTRLTLATRFPHCFAQKGEQKRPLAIGIRKDIAARCPDLTAAQIKRAIRDYVLGPKYLRHMVAGALRVDLDGNVAGAVSEAHAAQAVMSLRGLEQQYAEHAARMAAASNLALAA